MRKVQEINVYVVVFNPQGRLLMLHRKSPDIWEFPGGQLEWGESPEAAAVRETKEETGLNVKIDRLLCTTSSTFVKPEYKVNKHAVYIVFVGRGGGKVKISGEHSEHRWATLAGVRRMKLGYNAAAVPDSLK